MTYHPSCPRPGKVLTLFVLLLPVLIGLVGLTVDVGLLLAAYRQVQNATDAAALATAKDLLDGKPNPAATATTYVQQYFGLSQATVTVNIPPGKGPYAGNSNYVEVLVSSPANTWFIQILGVEGTQTVSGRSVAGFEAVAPLHTVLTLDPNAFPGLMVDGTTLQVNGRIAVNSQGAGTDQHSNAVTLGCPNYAASLVNGGVLKATEVRVVGGVNNPSSIQPYSGSGSSPLTANSLLISDPLLYLPTPTGSNGVVVTYPSLNGKTYTAPQNVAVAIQSGQASVSSPETATATSITFSSGIYASIQITGDSSVPVTFNPGIYVLQGGNSNRALYISGNPNVTVNGAMFYNTGSNYNATTGGPDSGDGNTLGTDPGGTTFGAITINAGTVTLNPLGDANSPFAGMLVYQRRWNTMPITIQGNSNQDLVAGTLYARWTRGSLQGPGAFTGQYLFGSLTVSGAGATVTLNPGTNVGKGKQVFLVE